MYWTVGLCGVECGVCPVESVLWAGSPGARWAPYREHSEESRLAAASWRTSQAPSSVF